MKKGKIVFEHNFGNDTLGKVVYENGKYQCYETPLFGGEFMKVGGLFTYKNSAIEYLKSLT